MANKIISLIKNWLYFGISKSNKSITLQILLLNTIATIGFLCLFAYSYIFYKFNIEIFYQVSLTFAILYMLIPIMSRFGFVNLSRYFIIFLGNAILLLLSIVFCERLNFHIFFILQVIAVFLIFKYNEIKHILISLAITFISIGMYEIDYWFFRKKPFHIILSDKDIYTINNILFITLVVTILIFITFFIVYLQKSEDNLKKMNEELKDKTSNLIQVEKFSALGELTAGISHELNQPLNVINIISQAVLRDVEKNRFTTDNLKNDMCEINVQIQRMSEIIEHMKIFTRSSEGHPKEELNINLIIDGVLNFFREQFNDNNIEIYVELARNIPYILGDSLRLEHLLINLITNARDAVEKSSTGMKIIKIKTDKIEKDMNEYILFQIYDNGDGVKEQVISKIFQPFFTTKEPGQGTGLGLAIVNKIVEDHAGHIEFMSKEGQGTTVNVFLPV